MLRFVSGGAPAGELDIGRRELIQLPPAVAADVHFSAILDEDGRPIDDVWRDRRRDCCSAAFEAERPDLVLIEMFPFGRRQFAFELLPLLEAAKARGLPDRRLAARHPGGQEQARAHRRDRGRGAPAGRPRCWSMATRGWCGWRPHFPARPRSPIAWSIPAMSPTRLPPATPAAEGAEVLVSAGGGAVGGPLLRAALAARPATSLAEAPWRLIAGPNLPAAEFAGLQQRSAASAAVTVERFRADFPALLARSRLSLSQAGYNTVMDILAVGARALVLPFAEGARERAEPAGAPAGGARPAQPDGAAHRARPPRRGHRGSASPARGRSPGRWISTARPRPRASSPGC